MMGAYEEKRNRLAITWLVLQFVQFVYIASSWAFVLDSASYESYLESEGAADEDFQFFSTKSLELFTLMWFCIVSLSITVSGILVMKYRRTKVALGFFVGVAFTMSSWSLTQTVKAGHIMIEKKYTEDSHYTRAYVEIRALFSILMCLLYIVFGVLLFSWQDDLVKLSRVEVRAMEELHLYENDEEICTKDINILSSGRSISSTTGESVVQS